ncbi:MAG TPA: TIGR01777 family protein, partial [Desulfobulbaceae bacterium]|nr:TIGR01777 family protein [Desulfobulbaceae bacterium]
MKTLITGCSGLVGNALIEYLFAHGHSIQCLKRSKESRPGHFWAIDALPNRDNNFDAVIHLAGENVAQNRWTSNVKKEILRSRVDGTRELIDFIASLPHKPQVFLCASGVGYYGSKGDEILDEDSAPGEGFLAEVCRQWEKETERLTAMGVRVVKLRFGMILSPKGGALHKMIGPFKSGFGGVVGSGNQYLSWISI